MKKMIRYVSVMLIAVLLTPVFSVSAADERRTVRLGGVPFGLTMYTGGVIVVNVREEDDSPAYAAGIRENDLILSADGEEVSSNEELKEIVSESGGEDIELSVIRGKSPISVTITPE